jgi:hypothetical protein
MRWFLAFMSTVSLWVFVTMPEVRREIQHEAISYIGKTIRG